MSELAAWDSFFVIVGSAAGALIGLQFVVMTLIAARHLRVAEAGAVFATPTIVHFSSALLLSALLRAPWATIILPAALWGLIGFGGVAYGLLVARRMRAEAVYAPEFEDWLFHVLLPLAAHAIFAVSALAALYHSREALFGVGLQRYCCCSLEFTMPGTTSSTMYLPDKSNRNFPRRSEYEIWVQVDAARARVTLCR